MYAQPIGIVNDLLAMFYANSNGVGQLAVFDGTSIALIPHPADGVAFGPYQLNIIPIIFDNTLYLPYTTTNNSIQLARFNGSSISLIPHPAGGTSFGGYPVVFNHTLFFSYQTPNNQNQLAGYDEKTNTINLIPHPVDGVSCIGGGAPLGNALFVSYLTANGNSRMAKYGVEGFSLLPHPTDGVVYVGAPILFNYALFSIYVDNTGTSRLARLGCESPIAAQVAPPAGIGTLGGQICTLDVSLKATGNTFVFTGPDNYVFSGVYRRPADYQVRADQLKTPGTYTLKVASTNDCGESKKAEVSFSVSGTACR